MQISSNRQATDFTVKPIFFGVISALFVIIIGVVILGILTEFGWTGSLEWPGTLYSLFVYLAIVIGSVTAGLKSGKQGWLTGMGVGIASSFCFFIFAVWFGNKIYWPLFPLKVFISAFIGIFGGVIGVNFAKRQ